MGEFDQKDILTNLSRSFDVVKHKIAGGGLFFSSGEISEKYEA